MEHLRALIRNELKKGLSQNDLARRIGVSQPLIQKILNEYDDIKRIKIPTLDKIARHFHLSLNSLIVAKEIDADQDSLIRPYQNHHPSQFNLILTAINTIQIQLNRLESECITKKDLQEALDKSCPNASAIKKTEGV